MNYMKQLPGEPHLIIIAALLLVSIVSVLGNVVQWSATREVQREVDTVYGERDDAYADYAELQTAAENYLAVEGKGCEAGVAVEDCLTILATDLAAKSGSNEGIIAHVVETIEANKSFTLPSKPNIRFTIRRVSRASGGVATAECKHMPGSEKPNFIFVRDASPLSALLPFPIPAGAKLPSGACLDVSQRESDGSVPALAVAELEVVNGGTEALMGGFLMMMYTPRDGRMRDALARGHAGSISQFVPPLSSRTFRVSFIIPFDQEEVRLVYGDYPPILFGVGAGPAFFEKSSGGFSIDFREQTFFELPG